MSVVAIAGDTTLTTAITAASCIALNVDFTVTPFSTHAAYVHQFLFHPPPRTRNRLTAGSVPPERISFRTIDDYSPVGTIAKSHPLLQKSVEPFPLTTDTIN